jgi:hypothetical protein
MRPDAERPENARPPSGAKPIASTQIEFGLSRSFK